jgi:simple sugar transport system permease protein
VTVLDTAEATEAAVPPPAAPKRPPVWVRIGRYLTQANQVMVVVYGLLIALVIGALLLTFSTAVTRHAMGELFSHPGSALGTVSSVIGRAYRALFEAAIVNPQQLWHSITTGQGWVITATPISQTLVAATPLIIAGLGVGIGFETGIFNIGGASQVTLGAVCAAYVAVDVSMPSPWHVIACVLAGMAGGAFAGAIPGVLKAYTGAHEVITTIMLNYIVGGLLIIALSSSNWQLQPPNSVTPDSKIVPPSAQLPHLLGQGLPLTWGVLIALAAAVVGWWLLDRSTMGFRFRITGASPHAARTAGIDAKRTLIAVFLVSGAFVGLAGMVQLNGSDLFLQSSGPQGYASTIGFSAITVALLGRNRPLGIVLGAILIGALVNGAVGVEAATGISTDLTTIVQAVMVLCVAAPAMVARIFHLRPGNAVSLEFGGWGT